MTRFDRYRDRVNYRNELSCPSFSKECHGRILRLQRRLTQFQADNLLTFNDGHCLCLFQCVHVGDNFNQLSRQFRGQINQFLGGRQRARLRTIGTGVINRRLHFCGIFSIAQVARHDRYIRGRFQVGYRVFFDFRSFTYFRSTALTPIMTPMVIRFGLRIQFLRLAVLQRVRLSMLSIRSTIRPLLFMVHTSTRGIVIRAKVMRIIDRGFRQGVVNFGRMLHVNGRRIAIHLRICRSIQGRRATMAIRRVDKDRPLNDLLRLEIERDRPSFTCLSQNGRAISSFGIHPRGNYIYRSFFWYVNHSDPRAHSLSISSCGILFQVTTYRPRNVFAASTSRFGRGQVIILRRVAIPITFRFRQRIVCRQVQVFGRVQVFHRVYRFHWFSFSRVFIGHFLWVHTGMGFFNRGKGRGKRLHLCGGVEVVGERVFRGVLFLLLTVKYAGRPVGAVRGALVVRKRGMTHFGASQGALGRNLPTKDALAFCDRNNVRTSRFLLSCGNDG